MYMSFVPMKTVKNIGLPIFLGFPFLMKLLPRDVILGEVFMWFLFLMLIGWIYLAEKRTLTSIGWKKVTPKMVLLAIGLGLVLFVLFGLLSTGIQAVGLPLNKEVAEMFTRQPFYFLMLVALRAGVVEEVLYRGYAIERIEELTNSRLLAGFFPLIIFVLLHLSWGVGHLLFVFIVGGLFTLIYFRMRNVVFNVIAHFTVDVVVMIVLPMMVEGG